MRWYYKVALIRCKPEEFLAQLITLVHQITIGIDGIGDLSTAEWNVVTDIDYQISYLFVDFWSNEE